MVYKGLERQLGLEHLRTDVLARHASSSLWAAVRETIPERVRACEDSRFGLKQSTFPWVNMQTPDEARDEKVSEQIEDVEKFNEALRKNDGLVASLDKVTDGMLERFSAHLAEQSAKQRAGSAAQKALEEIQSRVDQRAAEERERKRRLSRRTS